MDLKKRFKRGLIQLIDRDARIDAKQDREEKRTKQISKLESANISEALKREKMRSGERPLKLTEYAGSKLREQRNKARISTVKNLNRDKIAEDLKEGAKGTGRRLIQEARSPTTREKIRRYAREMQAEQRSNPDPMGLGVIFGSESSGGRQKRGRSIMSTDYDMLAGDPFGLSGYPGAQSSKRSKRRSSDWDWMH